MQNGNGGVPSIQGPASRETPKVVKAAGAAAKVGVRAGAKAAKVGTEIGGKTTKGVGGATVAVVLAVGKFSLKRVVPWGSVLARTKQTRPSTHLFHTFTTTNNRFFVFVSLVCAEA